MEFYGIWWNLAEFEIWLGFGRNTQLGGISAETKNLEFWWNFGRNSAELKICEHYRPMRAKAMLREVKALNIPMHRDVKGLI